MASSSVKDITIPVFLRVYGPTGTQRARRILILILGKILNILPWKIYLSRKGFSTKLGIRGLLLV
jgi:hypothetical protein